MSTCQYIYYNINLNLYIFLGEFRPDYRMDNNRPCCKHHDFEMPKNIIFSLFLTLEETTSSQYAGQIRGMFDIVNTVSQKTITTQVYHGMCFI